MIGGMGPRLFAMLTLLLLAAPAAAQDREPITDRGFAIDLHNGAVLGSSRIIGMGGTSIAVAEGSAYTPANVAAPAVRPASSKDVWDWDWHFDWLNPDLGSDFDNNGDPTTEIGQTLLLTAGILGQYRQWALAFSFTYLDNVISTPATEDLARVGANVGKLVVARSFRKREITVGLGVKTADFLVSEVGTARSLFRLTGATLEAGAVYRPPEGPFRIGVTGALPLSTDEPAVEGCDPMDCNGFILPERVVVPWEIGVGFAWRFGRTPWNIKIDAPWRDEKELTLAADVVLVGPVANGHGVEAFLDQELQPSGRGLDVSVRVGAEYEWIPSWLRVRGGGYWEPSRFEGVPGRLHVTFGIEGRLFSFRFWGDPYRVRLALTGDVARDYGNGALSLGFW